MTDDENSLYDHVRAELVSAFGMHVRGREGCLCGAWAMAEASWAEHLADAALAILYGEP